MQEEDILLGQTGAPEDGTHAIIGLLDQEQRAYIVRIWAVQVQGAENCLTELTNKHPVQIVFGAALHLKQAGWWTIAYFAR